VLNLLNYKTLTFVDTETTSLDVRKSEILSICIWNESRSGNIEKWSTKIKPKRIEDADKEALKICRYSEDEWSDAPNFEDVASTIEEKLRWGPIIGHNVSFDIRHLKAAFRRYVKFGNMVRFGYPLIDTIPLAWLYLDTNRQNLNACREHMGISTDRAHDCINDVEDCRRLFWNIVDKTMIGMYDKAASE